MFLPLFNFFSLRGRFVQQFQSVQMSTHFEVHQRIRGIKKEFTPCWDTRWVADLISNRVLALTRVEHYNTRKYAIISYLCLSVFYFLFIDIRELIDRTPRTIIVMFVSLCLYRLTWLGQYPSLFILSHNLEPFASQHVKRRTRIRLLLEPLFMSALLSLEFEDTIGTWERETKWDGWNYCETKIVRG